MTQQIHTDQLPQGEDWHIVGAVGEVQFENSWKNHPDYYPTVAYRKDPYGVVHLRGMCSGGTVDTDIFTLPVGYRPAKASHHVTDGHNTGVYSSAHIYSTGEVRQRTGNNTWIGFDNIRFTADQ